MASVSTQPGRRSTCRNRRKSDIFHREPVSAAARFDPRPYGNRVTARTAVLRASVIDGGAGLSATASNMAPLPRTAVSANSSPHCACTTPALPAARSRSGAEHHLPRPVGSHQYGRHHLRPRQDLHDLSGAAGRTRPLPQRPRPQADDRPAPARLPRLRARLAPPTPAAMTSSPTWRPARPRSPASRWPRTSSSTRPTPARSRVPGTRPTKAPTPTSRPAPRAAGSPTTRACLPTSTPRPAPSPRSSAKPIRS